MGNAMRILVPVLFAAGVCSGSATASSISVVPPSTERPSLTILGPLKTAGSDSEGATDGSISAHPTTSGGAEHLAASPAEIVSISASIVAMGEPAVSFDKVAAIGGKDASRKRDPRAMPMVIRGGVTDGAAGSSASPSPQPARQAATTPAPEASARPAKPRAAAAPKPAQGATAPAGDIRKPE